jgi:curved DNA-binding protein CbpA
VKDYYAILGLDPEASPESIKVAYRRLANQYHPDRLTGASPEEVARSSDRMREINEAYSILSRRARGRVLPERQGQEPPVVVVPHRPAETVRPDRSVVFSSLSAELWAKVHRTLSNSGNRWHEESFEGFDWGMASGSLLAKYGVAFRGFPAMDLDMARKFGNYAQVVIERSSSYRRNFLLFLIAFQRISQAEEIAATFRQFCHSNRNGKIAEIEIALVDMGHAKTVVCGPKVRDERYAKLLQQLGFATR